MREVSALILAGGRSSRMGRDKALLDAGGPTFLETLCAVCAGFPETLVSVDRPGRFALPAFSAVRETVDRFPGAGPLGGLHAGLLDAEYDRVFAAACDMPSLSAPLAAWLCGLEREGYDAVVAVSPDGRVHPLCAVYSRRCLAAVSSQLTAGRYRMLDLLSGLRVRYVPLCQSPFGGWELQNINTPEAYRALQSTRRCAGA